MGYVRSPSTISCRRENPGCREFCVGGAGRSARRRQGTVRQSYPLLRWYLSPTSRLRRLSIIAWRAGAVNRDRATRLDRVRLFDRPLCSGKRGNQHRRDALVTGLYEPRHLGGTGLRVGPVGSAVPVEASPERLSRLSRRRDEARRPLAQFRYQRRRAARVEAQLGRRIWLDIQRWQTLRCGCRPGAKASGHTSAAELLWVGNADSHTVE